MDSADFANPDDADAAVDTAPAADVASCNASIALITVFSTKKAVLVAFLQQAPGTPGQQTLSSRAFNRERTFSSAGSVSEQLSIVLLVWVKGLCC